MVKVSPRGRWQRRRWRHRGPPIWRLVPSRTSLAFYGWQLRPPLSWHMNISVGGEIASPMTGMSCSSTCSSTSSCEGGDCGIVNVESECWLRSGGVTATRVGVVNSRLSNNDDDDVDTDDDDDDGGDDRTGWGPVDRQLADEGERTQQRR